jgi:GTP-binding protein LepA
LLRAGTQHEVVELGQFVPGRKACDELTVGQVGYLICNIKSLGDVHIGDTVSTTGPDAAAALPGYDRPKRMVYCGLFPSDGQDFTELREALERLAINDPSFDFEPETSDALGFGFRCGFLGLLHMEIVQQRLEQESDVDLVQTAPNVTYEIVTKNGETLTIHKPQDVPDAGDIEEFRQPIVRCNIVIPTEYIGAIMRLAQERRGIQRGQEYIGTQRAMLTYDIPLAEVIYDLHDKIKSATRGYGTLDYEMVGYEPAELVRLDILVNGNRVDALSVVCNRADADRRGRAVAKKLKAEIERHMFEVAVQAAIGSRVIARETVPAMRKNVTAKCYGGDITRKRKLLQKQKEGKKRMKAVGNVEISQKAFMAVLSGADGGEG